MLGCCTFDHVTSNITMEQIHLKTLCPYMGETDSGAKGLVKYYVKPDELFCVALKVCTGHRLFGKLGAKLWEI